MKIKSFEIENGDLNLTMESGEKISMGEYKQYLGRDYDGVVIISHDGHHPTINYYDDGELPGRPAPGMLVIDCIAGAPYIAE